MPKTTTKSKEVELTAGKEVLPIDPNRLTIVDAKHPLASKLFLNRNNTKYETGSPAVESFKAEGQLQPAGVFPYVNESTGKKELVVAFGNQRVLKARAAGMTVNVVVFEDWTPDDAERACIVENQQREDLNFPDMLLSLNRAIARHKAAGTKNVYGAVALEFNQGSHQWARNMEAVSRLPKQILKQIPTTISPTAAIQLTKFKTAEEQLKAYQEMIADEGSVSAKGGRIKVSKASRKANTVKDTLSKAEWKVIAADQSVDFGELTDEEVRALILSVIGELDVNESQRAGLSFVKHVEIPKKSKKAKGKKGAESKPVKKVNIENLAFDEDEEDVDDVEEDVDFDTEDFDDEDDE